MNFTCRMNMAPVFLCCIIFCIYGSQITDGVKRQKRYSRQELSDSGTDNATVARIQKEMLAMQRWKNAEKIIHNITLTALKNFVVYAVEDDGASNVSSKCLGDIGYVVRALASRKFWAFKMVDASAHIPPGTLTGSFADFGSYDSCLEVDVKSKFKGKFCSVRLNPVRFSLEETHTIDLQKYIHLKENINEEEILPRFLDLLHPYYAFFMFRISLCVPSSCDEKDIEILVDKASQYIGLEWEANVIECLQKEDESPPYSANEITAIFLLSFMGILAVAGTMTEVFLIYASEDKNYKASSGYLVKFLLCFSFYTNTKRLLKEDDNPDSINIFHGLKFVTILWVILNHSYNNFKPEFMSNSLEIKDMMAGAAFQVVINGYPSVDTFFFISGVILVYARMKSKDDHLNAFLYIFRRAWRLAPPIVFLTMLFFLFGRLGNGPLWKEYSLFTKENCEKYWWTNILFINNYVKSEDQCMGWLWYVGADMQLYIFSLVVLIPIKKKPRLGLWILGICYVLGIGVICFNHLYFDLPPSVVMSAFKHPTDIFRVTERLYYPSYVHIVTWCSGMATGYVLYKNPKISIPFWLNAIGWMFSLAMGLAVVYGVQKFNAYVPATQAESLIYAIGSKIAWGVALAWVTIICYSGNGGLIKKFLSWKLFVPFSRMTYSTYLVHSFIVGWFVFGTRNLLEPRHKVVIFLYFSFVVTSFMLAFVFTQVFESPFMLLEKLALSPRTRKEETKQNGHILEDGLEKNNIKHTSECEEKKVPDTYLDQLEYKNEVNSSSL